MGIQQEAHNPIKVGSSKKFEVPITRNNGKFKTDPQLIELSAGALLFIGTACVVASLLLIWMPYLLYPQFYAPMADPSLNIVVPNTPTTWAILITGLFLLAAGIFILIKAAVKQKEPRWFRRSIGGF